MKKILMLSMFLSLFFRLYAINDNKKASDKERYYVEIKETRDIKVVKFTRIGNTTAYTEKYYDATYDSEDNSIKVYDEDYDFPIVLSVQENRFYGQDGDYRSGYRYSSGGEYFYNL